MFLIFCVKPRLKVDFCNVFLSLAMKFCCLRAPPHKTDIKELVATKTASHRLCLDQKAAPERTAKITTDSQLAVHSAPVGWRWNTSPQHRRVVSSLHPSKRGNQKALACRYANHCCDKAIFFDSTLAKSTNCLIKKLQIAVGKRQMPRISRNRTKWVKSWTKQWPGQWTFHFLSSFSSPALPTDISYPLTNRITMRSENKMTSYKPLKKREIYKKATQSLNLQLISKIVTLWECETLQKAQEWQWNDEGQHSEESLASCWLKFGSIFLLLGSRFIHLLQQIEGSGGSVRAQGRVTNVRQDCLRMLTSMSGSSCQVASHPSQKLRYKSHIRRRPWELEVLAGMRGNAKVTMDLLSADVKGKDWPIIINQSRLHRLMHGKWQEYWARSRRCKLSVDLCL